MARHPLEQRNLERITREIGEVLADAVASAEKVEGLPPRSLAFMLVLSNAGPNGFQAYCANMSRDQAISSLRELLENLRGA